MTEKVAKPLRAAILLPRLISYFTRVQHSDLNTTSVVFKYQDRALELASCTYEVGHNQWVLVLREFPHGK